MSTLTVAARVAQGPLYGLPAANNVPASLWDQCRTVATRNMPTGAPADFVDFCTSCLIVRGLTAQHKVPGDCASAAGVDFSNVQITQGIGQIAGSIASMAGASLPGIGAAISLIESIFAHHDQAVANEQNVICQVSGIINQVLTYYDAQVKSGALSPSTAYAGMQNFLAQCNARLSTIYKKCNASCVYGGVIAAHADFVQTYYPLIAPVQVGAHAPGAAPSATGTTPGGVVQIGNAVSSALSTITSGLSGAEKLVLLGLAAVGAFFAIKAVAE